MDLSQRAIGVADCSCGCGKNCSCVTLERFRQLAMSNIEPELFWGLSSTGDVLAVPPQQGLNNPSPLICYPGPQRPETCMFAPDGTYHCSGGTHGTWDPSSGPPPNFADPTIIRNADGTWVDPSSGTSGTWVHADGTVDPNHTGIQCVVGADGMSYTCSDGSSGTIENDGNGPPPSPGSTCTYLPDGTYTCTNGASGTYTVPPSGSGSDPSQNPNTQCVTLPNGSFICDDGTIGTSYNADGSSPSTAAPDGTCTYLPDGTYNCPDGTYGIWGWSGPTGWTGTNGGTSQGASGGSYTTYLPFATGNTYNPDGTGTDANGNTFIWFPIIANDVVDDPGATYNNDGTYTDSSGNTGIYLPIVITDPAGAAAPPPAPNADPAACTFYTDGTFVCEDGASGTWDVLFPEAYIPGQEILEDEACTYFWKYGEDGEIVRAYHCTNGLSGTHVPPVHMAENEEGELVPIPPAGPEATNPAYAPEEPVWCNFQADGSYLCSDGTAGGYTQDNSADNLPTDSCMFYRDGTYACLDGSTGTWTTDPIESFNPASDGTLPDGWGDVASQALDDPTCYYFADGTYTCLDGSTGQWSMVGEDRCYYHADGTYTCDSGKSGTWTGGDNGTIDGPFEAIDYFMEFLAPEPPECTYLTGVGGQTAFVCNNGATGYIEPDQAVDPNLVHEEPAPIRRQVGDEVCTYYTGPNGGGWRCAEGSIEDEVPPDDSGACTFNDNGTYSCPDGTSGGWTVEGEPEYPSYEDGSGTDIYLPYIDTGYGDPTDVDAGLGAGIEDVATGGGGGGGVF